MKAPSTRALGAAALAAYLIHGSTHIRLGAPEGMLWMCNTAVLLVGAGLVIERARPVAVGLSWLVVGNVLWILDLIAGGDLLPTSLLTHIGGLVIAIVGLRRLGFPPRTWAYAALAVALLQEITRLTTPARSNVNVAFAMYRGSEDIFSNFYSYRAALLAAGAVAFALVELALRRCFPPSNPARDPQH